MTFIQTAEELDALYGKPVESATIKVTRVITEDYRRLIEASPFVALATAGPEGLDCSPRGDHPGFIRVDSPKRILLPDRRGNNRVDSLRNIVHDPRVALLFFIPGSIVTLRVNGNARISVDEPLLKSFEVDGKSPRSVIVVDVSEVYFQCGRALMRSDIWNTDRHVPPDQLPTPGEILANLSSNRLGGEAYDNAWPDRARNTLW
ncbi:MAG: pyridoxamine 5'-phosphate oxidase family protein [Planctomycetota bacterium]